MKVAPSDRKAARRLDSFRRFLTHVSAYILPDIGFVLWDGSTVPADLAPDALALVIADEGAVAAMIRRPSHLCPKTGRNATDLRQKRHSGGPAARDKHLSTGIIANFGDNDFNGIVAFRAQCWHRER